MEQIVIELTVNKWLLYIIVVAILISFVSNLLGLYQRYLDRRIENYKHKETGLMKCPFCGCDAEIEIDLNAGLYWSRCSNEYCHAKPFCEADSVAEAVEMWNGRD